MIIASSSLERAKRELMLWSDEGIPQDTQRSWDIVSASHEATVPDNCPVSVRMESLVSFCGKKQKVANIRMVPLRYVDTVIYEMRTQINEKEWETRDELEGRS